jgi:hypothetical protein
MQKCEKCTREFSSKAGLSNHKNTCDGTIPAPKWSCPKCNHYIHSQRDRHVEICDGLGPNAHRRAVLTGHGKRGGWNKGIKSNEETKQKISESLRGREWKASSEEVESERRRKISESMKKNPLAGGYRKGSGVGKGCWHHSPIAGDVYLDSTYEKRVAKCLDENNVMWERNIERFPYEYAGKTHFYIPDFKIEGTFVEVKGYVTEKDIAKWKFFPHNIIILKNVDIINMEQGKLPKWS